MQLDFNNLIEKFKYDPNSVKKDYDGKTDIYLAKASYRYAYFRRILCVLLILVIIAFLLSGSLSYDKLFYLTKDIKLANDYVNSVHDTITYNVGNSQSFITYREGLAVASRERLSVFSAGGREIFSSNHSYGNPALASSEKYVLLYDVGGKQFALYNSFSQVKNETLDYTIYGASIARNGTFALITRADRYDSVVSVYKTNGTRYDYSFSEGRVISVSLSEKGTEMAVLLTLTNGDGFYTELRLYRIGKEDYSSANTDFDGIPYAVKILDGGNIMVVGANGVNTFNSNLNLLNEYFTDEEIYRYYFGEDSIAISHLSKESGKTEVVILNKRGKIDKKYLFDDRILDVALCDGYLFVQTLGGFERRNMTLNTSEKIDIVATDYKMIVSDKNTLIICDDSYAKYLNIGE
ncbi:MAG: hypothetical protein J6S23_00300 [Clostridia bacterium]|nr:hypothetical protein [Clostridia bacterium]